MASTEICRLCLTQNTNYIDLFNGSEYSNYILSVITEHIGDVKENDLLPKYVCRECWKKTGSFHTFHRSVQSAQSNFLMTLVKSEFTEPEVNFDDNHEPITLPSFVEVQSGIDADEIGQTFGDEQNAHDDNDLLTVLKTDPVFGDEDDTSEKEQLTKISPSEANFDYTCDICHTNQETLMQTLKHYADEHKIPGYIKCCDKKFFLESTVSDHIDWHRDPEIFNCKLCPSRLTTKRSYYKHKSMHNRRVTSFICDYCNRGFNFKESLKRHIFIHMKVPKVKCFLCYARFKTTEELNEHQCNNPESIASAKLQHDSLKDLLPSPEDVEKVMTEFFDMSCDLCDVPLNSISLQQTQQHYLNEHRSLDGEIKCCGIKFKEQSRVIDHIPYHINKDDLKCIVCSRQFVNIRQLRGHLYYHIQRLSGNERHEQRNQHRCKKCRTNFSSEINLKLHLQRNHEKKTRPAPTFEEGTKPALNEYFDMRCTHAECDDIVFESLQDAKIHYLKEHGNCEGFLMCCGIICKTDLQVDDHLFFHMDPNHFKCDMCDKQFKTKLTLISHLSKHKAINSKRYQCKECDKSFASNHCLKRHMQRHDEIKLQPKTVRKFKCSFCNRVFGSEELRKSHEDRIHRKVDLEKNEICEFCAKRFAKKENVESHVRRVHMGNDERPKFQCYICNAWLSNRYILRTHIQKHTSKSIKCPQCDKEYPNREALSQHITRYHLQKRVYKCNLCEKSFKEERALKSHIGTHTGEKMFPCSYCPEAFIWKPNMYSHQKKMHPNEWAQRNKHKKYIHKQN